jgi:hypothetical protein
MSAFHKSIGPFAIAEEHAYSFCHNLFLSNTVNQCAMQLAKIEQEYNRAVSEKDDELARKKQLELQTYQSSLILTARIFYETDEVSA